MKIGIISDLHGLFPMTFKRFLADIDELWALGDYGDQETYEDLIAFNKPTIAITGNCDEESNLPLCSALNKRETFEREGIKILLAHKGYYRTKDGQEHFSGQNIQNGVDLFCYGHMHRFEALTSHARKDGKPTYCLNPGALTPKFNNIASAVVLEIENGRIFNCKVKKAECFDVEGYFTLMK